MDGDVMESWEKKVKEAYLAYDDTPTYIKAYRKNDLYIVHGEIAIYCFDQNLEKKWEFFGRDIWVTQDGSEAISLFDDYIELKDWLGYTYRINYQGEEENIRN